jgi:hypothetical protein
MTLCSLIDIYQYFGGSCTTFLWIAGKFLPVTSQKTVLSRNIMILWKQKLRCCTRWFKYDRDDLCVNKSQFVLVIFEPPCMCTPECVGYAVVWISETSYCCCLTFPILQTYTLLGLVNLENEATNILQNYLWINMVNIPEDFCLEVTLLSEP